tara:strand:- start:1846 stop:2046 length:201 start_codon:yes stop_codon:yes gene_type:complete
MQKHILGGYFVKPGIDPDDKDVRICKKYGWVRLICDSVEILEYCHKIDNFKIVDIKRYKDIYKKRK